MELIYNNNKYWMKKDKDGILWTDVSGTWQAESSIYIKKAYALSMKRNKDRSVEAQIANYVQAYLNELTSPDVTIKGQTVSATNANLVLAAEQVSQQLIDFFSEFQFEPNFRFINTLAKTVQRDEDGAKFVFNYFNLTNHVDKFAVKEKMKSVEFENILQDLCNFTTSNVINTRFELFYGSQGTGKTTEAIEKASTIMVCHSAMLPQDLMEDFHFVEGKPEFEPSALCLAMTQGHTIVLDEINMLPFESLRFLQSLLDNKKYFDWKTKTIDIHENFKVIGTMNLIVNGSVYALPEPLVDRASNLREYKLTAQQLAGALL